MEGPFTMVPINSVGFSTCDHDHGGNRAGKCLESLDNVSLISEFKVYKQVSIVDFHLHIHKKVHSS